MQLTIVTDTTLSADSTIDAKTTIDVDARCNKNKLQVLDVTGIWMQLIR